MVWRDFEERALKLFNMPREDIGLAYRLSVDGRGLTNLTCENHWDAVLIHVKERCLAA